MKILNSDDSIAALVAIRITEPPGNGWFFYIWIHLIARKVTLFCLGHESGKSVFPVIAAAFVNGMSLKELSYPIK